MPALDVMKTMVILGATLLIAAIVWMLRSHRELPASPDGQVVEQLAKAGSDLSKPHNIEFFLYFPTQEAARAAASDINDPSFSAVVRQEANGKEWLLQLNRPMLPIEADLVALRSKLDSVAGKHGGVYDGWGSPVVSGA